MHLPWLVLICLILALTHNLWIHDLLCVSNLRVDMLRWSLILLVLVLLVLLLLHHHIMTETTHLGMSLFALPSMMVLVTETTTLHVISAG